MIDRLSGRHRQETKRQTKVESDKYIDKAREKLFQQFMNCLP